MRNKKANLLLAARHVEDAMLAHVVGSLFINEDAPNETQWWKARLLSETLSDGILFLPCLWLRFSWATNFLCALFSLSAKWG